MDKQNTVSVVMATYNGEQYIREQLDSIVEQTYPIYELIIQDDCSTDNTVSICREYESKFPFVHLFVNETNKGFNENFKSAVMRATGDIVAISDQDDIWFREKLEKQVAALGDKTMCYSPHLRGESMENSRLVDYKNYPEQHLFKAIVGHSMILRREFAQKDETWPGGLYYDIWLTILAYFENGVAKVEEPLNWHRTHALQASAKKGGNDDSLWKPYVYGLRNYRKLQDSVGWKMLYERVKKESEGKNDLIEKMCNLLLCKSPLALLKLCYICHKYRKTIYPTDRVSGVMGHVRSFCYPLIDAYYGEYFYSLH